jgi:hypothetical protein
MFMKNVIPEVVNVPRIVRWPRQMKGQFLSGRSESDGKESLSVICLLLCMILFFRTGLYRIVSDYIVNVLYRSSACVHACVRAYVASGMHMQRKCQVALKRRLICKLTDCI